MQKSLISNTLKSIIKEHLLVSFLLCDAQPSSVPLDPKNDGFILFQEEGGKGVRLVWCKERWCLHKLMASWGPYGEEYADRSFLSLASLLNLLLKKPTLFSSVPSYYCKGLLFVTYWLPIFARLVLYWRSQGKAETGEPTGTAPPRNF